jgi:hypothetical protein
MLNRLKMHFTNFLRKDNDNALQKRKHILTFETLQAMAQAYDDKTKEPPLLPATIETMRWAYEQICTGEDPWTALGNFTNAWYGYAKHVRADLVHEPLLHLEQETEYTRDYSPWVETQGLLRNISAPEGSVRAVGY